MIDKLIDLYISSVPLMLYLLAACAGVWLTETGWPTIRQWRMRGHAASSGRRNRSTLKGSWPPGMRMWDKLLSSWCKW